METDDLKAKLAQLEKDLEDHRQINMTQSHGENDSSLAIEVELERQIEVLKQTMARLSGST